MSWYDIGTICAYLKSLELVNDGFGHRARYGCHRGLNGMHMRRRGVLYLYISLGQSRAFVVYICLIVDLSDRLMSVACR